jgi:DNA polymerase-3 subunit epsilon
MRLGSLIFVLSCPSFRGEEGVSMFESPPTLIAGQRSVLFDTETTGLDPATGDRVIEVAAIELVRDLPTGKVFHTLIDPERDVPEEATRIHGFSRSDLMGKPRFADIADAFLAFIGDSPLVAHNAPFDFGFINAELARLALPPLDPLRMIDTLALAKARFPGMPNSLNALCTRFAIDLSERTTHNALLDCRLLADVYVELTGGRQRGLVLRAASQAEQMFAYTRPATRVPVLVSVSEAQLAAHETLVARLKDPVWAALA